MKNPEKKPGGSSNIPPPGIEFQKVLYNSANPTRRWLHRSRSNWIQQALQNCHTPDNHLAVDLGMGIGIYLPYLAQKYDRIIGLDISPAFLAQEMNEASRQAISFINGDIRFLPLADECADLALCSEVLEHIQEGRACLKEIFRILKPGGKLLLSTPQPFSLLEITARIALSPIFLPLTRLIYREPVYPTGHVNLMSAGKVRRLLRRQGFSIDKTFQSGLYLPFLAELFGAHAQAVAAAIDKKIRRGPLAPLLWTQFYVATKKAI